MIYVSKKISYITLIIFNVILIATHCMSIKDHSEFSQEELALVFKPWKKNPKDINEIIEDIHEGNSLTGVILKREPITFRGQKIDNIEAKFDLTNKKVILSANDLKVSMDLQLFIEEISSKTIFKKNPNKKRCSLY
jgi:hypothetical protein